MRFVWRLWVQPHSSAQTMDMGSCNGESALAAGVIEFKVAYVSTLLMAICMVHSCGDCALLTFGFVRRGSARVHLQSNPQSSQGNFCIGRFAGPVPPGASTSETHAYGTAAASRLVL